jgi:hypothetical protein
MNNHEPITPEDLILLACDELDEPRGSEVRSAVAMEPALTDELANWSATLTAIAAESVPLGDDFNATLRERIRASSPSARVPAEGKRRRWTQWLPLGLAAAAVLLLSLWLLRPPSKHDAGVAWADVVQAAAQVSQFHVQVFIDEPRRAAGPQLFRIDLFHKEPDLWRAQGMGHVRFIRDGDSKMWSIEKHRFLTADDQAPVRLMPDDFVENYRRDGMMGAILNELFDGKPPAGEPVKSDAAAGGDGVEVFDYARDPSNTWARIWVLKDSRLPIRVSIFEPRGDDTITANFDYSDPQPDAFFDPAAFEKQVNALGLTDPHQVYAVGTEPMNNKPRSADQIFQAQGGYKAPKVQRIEANEFGDVKVVTDNVRNPQPPGVSVLEDRYESVTDSWGNVYTMITAIWPAEGVGGQATWYYTPVPPVKTGDGVRTLTLKYVITEARNGPEGFKKVPLREETLPVRTLVSGYPKDWDADLAKTKWRVIADRLERTAPLQAQLQFLDEWLTNEPQSLDALLWRVRILKRYGRPQAARQLFESQLKDRVLAQPVEWNGAMAMADDLFDLARKGKVDDVAMTASSMRQRWDALKASGQADRVAPNGDYLFDNPHSAFHAALQIPEAMKAFAILPRPTPGSVVAGRDGQVFIDITLPAMPAYAAAYYKDYGGADNPNRFWGYPTLAKDSPWKLVAITNDGRGRTRMVIAGGDGKPCTLTATATIVANPNEEAMSLTAPWSIDVAVPSATVDDLPTWLRSKPQGAEFDQWAQPAQATSTTRSADDWDTEARAAADAGRFDEMTQILAPVESKLPAQVHPEDYDEVKLRQRVRAVHLAQVRWLASHGKADDARKLLDQMEAGRPDLRQVSDLLVYISRGGGAYTSWIPQSGNQDAWREFDSVKWDLIDKTP